MKTTFRKVMRASLVVALALLMTLSANFTAYAAIWYPANITALGDSITVAYDASGFGSQPIYSWSTGTSKSVNSMYLRLMAVKRTIRGHATNLAVPGATVADLNFQASPAFSLSSTQDYAAAFITPAVGDSLDPRRINP